MPRELTADIVRHLFDFEPDTGFLIWKNPPMFCSKKAGERAGNVNSTGYRRVMIEKKFYAEHRLIWLYYHGYWPQGFIDHKDGQKANNAIGNLRECDRSQNAANMKVTARSSTGLKGAYWSKRHNRFVSKIRVRGKYINLGLHKTAEQANAAYMAASQKLNGQFARAE
jgi:hypothetical protein